MVIMTIEQQIQSAIKAAFEEAFEDFEYDVYVHAVKLDNDVTDTENDKEQYPAVVINTSTPVPQGHKSRNLEIPCWITIMTYLPDDRKRVMLSEIAEAVFQILHGADNWDEYEDDEKTVETNAVVIDSSEEPATSGMLMIQVTNCTVHVNLLT